MLLNEIQQPEHQFKGIDDLIEFIQLKCSPYFTQTNKPLFRGMDIKKDLVIYKQRADRKPTSMPLGLHNALDEEFKKRFGHPYRSNAFFATGDRSFAGEYVEHLDPSIIIPIGNFSFCWSPEIDDLYNHIGQHDYDKPDFAKMYASETIDEGNYTDKNLDAAIESGNEIMVNGPNGFVVLDELNVAYYSAGKYTLTEVWKELI
jgi:hypothetical protein